ncbi:uncharacterized protein [Epargyreus clarus]|uniref:uncharacterized protein isoform X2 n=1 Tax=Epargyreus clarus TaxID=520877 RepID=UPI003C2F3E49
MTTTAKPQKDKPFGAAPRLTPRPTAASVARAARNATNRNMTLPMAQRQSPTRSPPSPVSSKIRTNTHRNGQRNDSKSDVKINRNCENVLTITDIEQAKHEFDPSYTESDATVILHDIKKEQLAYSSTADVLDVQDTNNFDLNRGADNSSKIDDNPTVLFESGNTKPNNTPVTSRPQTPKNVSSRPQTPRMQSRPSTPATAQRHSTPVSRPNTPQHVTTVTRPKTPTPQKSARPNTPVHTSQIPQLVQNDELKCAFTTKHQQYQRMKRELDLKQQAILEVFEGLRSLREHMSREGITGSEEELQEFMVFNVGDWAADEVAQLCRDAAAAAATDGAARLIDTIAPVDECAVAEVEAKALSVPVYFADLCIQAFSARQEIIDWIKDIIAKQELGNEEMDRIAEYNAQGLQLCESLRELKSQASDAVDMITQLSKRAFRERAALITVGESLVREVARLRQDLEARATVVQEVQENRVASETTKALEEIRRELDEEKAAKAAIKDKLATTESQLRQARVRVSKMDRQLREAEASIASLTGTVKSLEDQSRQKEVHLEARARKLKESLKTGEMASSQLSQQRDSLQAEVNELREQNQSIHAQHNSAVQDLRNEINELMAAVDEERKLTAQEKEARESLEKSLRDNEYTIEELKNKIVELENSKPNPELPTEREMDLWAELQATKDILRTTEDEVSACKREKARFLESLTKISETDNKVGMQQKLAAELLSKEEIVSKMHAQIRELTKNIKLNEQKVIQYEQYVRDLQAHNRAVANCQESPNGISYQDLQQEIMNLRMGLLEAVHKNEELSEMLVQKEQQLEQQDKTSRAQVREELINLLKNKETEQSRELSTLQQDLEHRMKIVDDVNKQIAAKADEIQELFSTLENKQQQIHRLEKIVLALEEQQRRAQAQRTRQEEKIAALEHELAAGNRRERKFLFF